MDKTDFEEQLRDARREVERERELLMEKMEAQENYLKMGVAVGTGTWGEIRSH